MHFFLTGGTGSIGSAVLAQAVAQGHRVTALVRSEAAAQKVTQNGAEALTGDIATPDTWMVQAVAAEAFVHLASSFDNDMARTEPHLIESLLRHAKDRPTPLRFLYTGGCWLYGQTGSAVADETSPLTPIAAFGWAAKAIAQLQDQPALSCAVVHPAMVYSEQGGVFTRMMKALRAGRPAPIWGSEYTRWPLIHREDAAAAYLMLAQKSDAQGAFNLVTERGVPVFEIAAVLSQQASVKTRPAVLPRKWALLRHGIWAEGPMLDQQMRSSRMEALGWAARHKDFRALAYRF